MLERAWTSPEQDIVMPESAAHVGFECHPPSWNRLIGALPIVEYERLLPDLEFVSLPPGRRIYDTGERQRYLYFLTGGIVCRLSVLGDGASAGCAVTGREGVIGLASFLGGDSTTSEAIVLSQGYAYRLRAHLLKTESKYRGPLTHLLLRYTQALFTQIGQIAACNRHHSLEQRLSRWILSCLDRLPSDELTMTHHLIASVLGVRREGITETIGDLQALGLIRHSRGSITVLDRSRLETRSCACYAVLKREYDRLLPGHRRPEVASRLPAVATNPACSLIHPMRGIDTGRKDARPVGA